MGQLPTIEYHIICDKAGNPLIDTLGVNAEAAKAKFLSHRSEMYTSFGLAAALHGYECHPIKMLIQPAAQPEMAMEDPHDPCFPQV